MTRFGLYLSPDGEMGGGEVEESGGGGEMGGESAPDPGAVSQFDLKDDVVADWSGDGTPVAWKDFRQGIVPKSEFSKAQDELRKRISGETEQSVLQTLNQRVTTEPQFRAQLRKYLGQFKDPQERAAAEEAVEAGASPSKVQEMLEGIRSGNNRGWVHADDLEGVIKEIQSSGSGGVSQLRGEVGAAFKALMDERHRETQSKTAKKQEARKAEILAAAQSAHSEIFEGDDGMKVLGDLFHAIEGPDDYDEFEPVFMEGVGKHVNFFGGRQSKAAETKAQESTQRVRAAAGGDGTPSPTPPRGGQPPDRHQVAQEMAAKIAARKRVS